MNVKEGPAGAGAAATPIDTDCECYGVGCWECLLAGNQEDDDD